MEFMEESVSQCTATFTCSISVFLACLPLKCSTFIAFAMDTSKWKWFLIIAQINDCLTSYSILPQKSADESTLLTVVMQWLPPIVLQPKINDFGRQYRLTVELHYQESMSSSLYLPCFFHWLLTRCTVCTEHKELVILGDKTYQSLSTMCCGQNAHQFTPCQCLFRRNEGIWSRKIKL